MNDELDLHGMTVADMLPALDDFLYRSYRAGRARVRVVHGKGTGVLRQEVKRFLSHHALVAGFRPADSRDGGDGALDVNLV
jgi:DNA mismatch repair protein MutS2